MKKALMYLFLGVVFLLPASLSYAQPAPDQAIEIDEAELQEQVEALQEDILSDEDLMAEIQKLLEDEEIVQLLSDPEVVQAITNYDAEAIQTNPNIQKLMDNPKIVSLIEKISELYGQ